MNRSMILGCVFAVGFASTAFACDKDKKAAKTVATTPCGKTIQTGVSESTATTVATKPCCEKSDGMPCCGGSATTVSTKSPCSGKASATATTVAAKPCCEKSDGKPCCGGSATTVSTKSPCSGGSAATVSTKSPCSGKASATVTSGSPCHGKSKGVTVASFGGCAKSAAKAVMASMPKMTYKVGDFETCCSKTAGEKAAETSQAVAYVVAGESFDGEAKAMAALASALNEQVEQMTHVQYVVGDQVVGCPSSAKTMAESAGTKVTYRLAGFDFGCSEKADKVAKEIQAAVSGITLTATVDGKPVPCCKSARAAGKTIVFSVGDEQIPCETTAQLKLAEMKLQTAVEKAAQASAS